MLRAPLFVQELINYQNSCKIFSLLECNMYKIIHGVRIVVMPCYIILRTSVLLAQTPDVVVLGNDKVILAKRLI